MNGDENTLFTSQGLKAAFQAALARDSLSAAEQDFVRQAFDDAREDELPSFDIEALGHLLAEAWKASDVVGDKPAISLSPVTTPSGERTLLDMLVVAQPDAPFLVDSVMGELTEQGFDVRAMFHPVVAVARDADGRRQASSGLVGIRRESIIIVVMASVGEDRRTALIEGVSATLADAHMAVADFEPMRALLHATVHELHSALSSPNSEAMARWIKARPGRGGGAPTEMVEEYLNFLRWLGAEHFVFLGARIYEYPRLANGDYAAEEPSNAPGGNLGVLRDDTRAVLRRASEPAVLTSTLKGYLETSPPVLVAKSNLRSRVHRRTYMDYIGVKRYAPDGAAIGEVRFVGLFTAEAYDEAARDIPLIRRKIAHIIARAGENPSAHNEKRLRNIIEGYPRDELFQADEDDLFSIATGILHLYDRPRVKLFVRRDPFDRFISVLFFTPRDRYNSETRELVAHLLAKAWTGRVSAYYPAFGAEPLARVHYVLGVTPNQHAEPDLRALEIEIDAATRTWPDRFAQAVREASGVAGHGVAEVLTRYAGAFPAGYQDQYDAAEALIDVAEFEALEDDPASIRVRAFRKSDDAPTLIRAKIYRRGEAAPLADVLPVFDNMGLKALLEEGYAIRRHGEDEAVWTHEFLLHDPRGADLSFADVKDPFEETFVAVWTGRAENDPFNRLVIELGLSWREAALIRALARYRQQTGLDPSERVQQEALGEHPGIARLLIDLFRVKFHPGVSAAVKERKREAQEVYAEIERALQGVESLDHDRALRRMAQLVQALQRTNFYQTDRAGAHRPHISFKIASRELEDLPAPKPYREIFVAAPHVEGVHLRFGPVARGGLRWSDRRDDFRTEVLGLVKAQQVKNAVIVPVGSKGGFYPKHLPKQAGTDAWRAEGVRAYKTFLQGLLDITDNLDAKGQVVHPKGVVALDGDDPYLVVAADKGTATFSDIANGVAQDYGFWLGDAFASGGSVGYDHKAMGITARGAWEAVKRHFREMGKDIQTEPFSCVGVGDMSGDVFGNGMLLSKATRLVAAFDHRHVFIDPDPDTEASWTERKRLFDLPRSSWADYRPELLSPGGAIYPRNAKSVTLTKEIKALLHLEEDEIAPVDLIRAILGSEVELLYLGGIGTYVKAPWESQAAAGDKANDAIRIDATELRCKVVGEGANLGFTQAGRIAFARIGGRINTDAIDNSAGVDTSDHEVNIKILTGQLERADKIDRKSRDALLASMTDDVAAHVLAHNYAQTLCLSLQESQAEAELTAHGRFMAELESQGRLDRKVEGLPSASQIGELKAAGKGLTRPELAVLTAYGKLELDAALVASDGPDDAWYEDLLVGYFPAGLCDYRAEMDRHRLRREIIATRLANQIVDRLGPTFAGRLFSSTGADAAVLARSFSAALAIFRLDAAWASVDAGDLLIPAEAQIALYSAIANALRGHVFGLALSQMQSGERPGVSELIETYRGAADALRAGGAELVSRFEKEQAAAEARRLVGLGAPAQLAKSVADLSILTGTLEIATLARRIGWPTAEAARLYHATGAAFGFNRLRAAAAGIKPADSFERAAVRTLVLDLIAQQVERAAAIAGLALGSEAGASPEKARAAIDAWSSPRKDAVRRGERMMAEIEGAGESWSFAKLTLAASALRVVG